MPIIIIRPRKPESSLSETPAECDFSADLAQSIHEVDFLRWVVPPEEQVPVIQQGPRDTFASAFCKAPGMEQMLLEIIERLPLVDNAWGTCTCDDGCGNLTRHPQEMNREPQQRQFKVLFHDTL